MDAEAADKLSYANLLKYVHGCRVAAHDHERSSGISWGVSRIYADLKEFREFHNEAFSNIKVSPNDDSIYLWDIAFPAPNGKFITATLKFDLEYPLVPPRIFIKQKIFHPNVSLMGEVCLQDLKNIWTPAHTIWSFILSVQYLLSDPNPHDPINPIAAKMFYDNPEEYQMYSLKRYDTSNDKNDSLTKDKPEKLVISQDGFNENTDGPKALCDEEFFQFEEELLFQHMLEKSVKERNDTNVIQ